MRRRHGRRSYERNEHLDESIAAYLAMQRATTEAEFAELLR